MNLKMRCAAAVLPALAIGLAPGAVVSLPEVAPSAFPDSESSAFREVAFERRGVVSIELDCPTTPTNCAEIVLGRDSDLDGDIGWFEASMKLGWNSGAWFVSSPVTGEEFFAEVSEVGVRGNLALSMRLDSRGRAVSTAFVADGAPMPAGTVPVLEAAGDISMWNGLRVVARGLPENVSIRVRSRRDGSMVFVK